MSGQQKKAIDGSVHVSDDDALKYHSSAPAGKLEIAATKPLSTQYDLAAAYSPGVAVPARAIAESEDASYLYTSKGNLVAIATNGTAVLGLGSIGASAAKPVMEGKAVLFKRFAGIDGFDLEVDERDPDAFIDTMVRLEPTFGGINLEDIKAPECFYIERELKRRCNIPVMHDDQHGTAIITGAALLNALVIAGKDIDTIRLVVIGAGAAGLACTRFYHQLGVRREHIVMIDADGVIRAGVTPDDHPAAEFATTSDVASFDEAIDKADVLLGVSVGGLVKPEHILKMNADPVVFALANPEPEIDYETAVSCRPDVIMATGRSDYPNQVNNVLGFPYIFRGALDVQAREINEAMKIAAAHALARLAREPVPDSVGRAYSSNGLEFSRTYVIPKPLDPRLLTTVAPAVARAAMESGVSRTSISDWDVYETELLERVGIGQKLISGILNQARREPKRVVFAEAEDYDVLKAADISASQQIASPILLGRRDVVEKLIAQHELQSLRAVPCIDPRADNATVQRYARSLYEKRSRKGVTRQEAERLMRDRNYFGLGMLEHGDADAFISGRTREYPSVIRPALQIIEREEGVAKVAGMYIVNAKRGVYFLADTTVNVSPSADDLVDIIGLTARTVRFFDHEPVVAVLSYSNFGSVRDEETRLVAEAVEKARKAYPDLCLDGEIQANFALAPDLLLETYPFSRLNGSRVNTLIFPNLSSGNIAYKLLGEIGGAELVGPILMGMKKPVHILQLGSSIREIVNMVGLSVVEAQRRQQNNASIREEFMQKPDHPTPNSTFM
ncbi:MAG: NADP-dependent malic enzyme [Spirochaetaceae bacterium]